MQRLNMIQKKEAIMTIMCRSKMSLSTSAIGRQLGYKNGQPVYAALDDLHKEELITFWTMDINTGTKGFYWGITETGRDVCKKLGIA